MTVPPEESWIRDDVYDCQTLDYDDEYIRADTKIIW